VRRVTPPIRVRMFFLQVSPLLTCFVIVSAAWLAHEGIFDRRIVFPVMAGALFASVVSFLPLPPVV